MALLTFFILIENERSVMRGIPVLGLCIPCMVSQSDLELLKFSSDILLVMPPHITVCTCYGCAECVTVVCQYLNS
jgi:hypothetical protein